MEHPLRNYPLPLSERPPVWLVASEDVQPIFFEHAFGDGSGINSKHGLSKRCGWAVCSGVALYQQPSAASERNVGAKVVAYGPLLGPCQEVPLAELQALVFTIQHVLPNNAGEFTFFTDCAWLLSSFAAGRESCTGASHVGAHLWKAFYRALDDAFENETKLTLVKVKSHTAFAANIASSEDNFRWGGNAIADTHAKKGAHMHPSDEHALNNVKVAEAAVTQVALYLARFAVWRRQSFGKPATEAHQKQGQLPYKPRPPALAGHRPCLEKQGRWRCVLCLSSAESLGVLRRWPCAVQQCDRPLKKHQLMIAGDLIFCSVCGFYSESRTRGFDGYAILTWSIQAQGAYRCF